MGRKQKVEKSAKPPELPPDIPDDDVEVSDEDLQFVAKNLDYAKFVNRLDTESITRHVSRSVDSKEDELEALYEKKLRKKKSLEKKDDEGVEVDPVDALPIKTMDGVIVYRTVPKKSNKEDEVVEEDRDVDDGGKKGIMKLSKAERRAQMKRTRKEAKKQAKEDVEMEEAEPEPQQAEVLAEMQNDLTAEEVAENKKLKIAELGNSLVSAPESNIKSLKELLQFCRDKDSVIVKLGLLSCLAVFRDIIPGYRIRLPTDKEAQMNVSRDVKKMRFYESTLLSSYKVYIQRLLALERQKQFHRVAVRCLCTLLDAVPHFNFRENLLPTVVTNLDSHDDVVRKYCSTTVESLFVNQGKHGGEATVEIVKLISELVKVHECQMHPDVVDVFLSLCFDEDLRKSEETDKDERGKHKKYKRGKKPDEEAQPVSNDKKRSKREMVSKTREEVNADFKAVSFTPDVEYRRAMQTETLHAVFLTYFRILKHTAYTVRSSSEENVSGSAWNLGPHPMLASSLKGIGKFSHLIDVGFMADITKCLKVLASGSSNTNNHANLTVSERLQCCIVAFQMMRNNLDSLRIDLQEFNAQLYNLILEYRPGRDHGEVFAEALKLMLCDERYHDMQRAAAFIKRLATSSLCFGSAESMAALVTVKNLLQNNVKCRSMLENDPGGGSVAGTVTRYQADASDPHLSGALSSVLWELSLLTKHYHPTISAVASSISNMVTNHNQVYMPTTSPQQALIDMSLEKETFNQKIDIKKLRRKGKTVKESPSLLSLDTSEANEPEATDEDSLKKKLTDHFIILRDICENERLRRELDRTNLSLQLYEEYKKRRKVQQEEPKQKKKRKVKL